MKVLHRKHKAGARHCERSNLKHSDYFFCYTKDCHDPSGLAMTMLRSFVSSRVLLAVLLIVLICLFMLLTMPHPHRLALDEKQKSQLHFTIMSLNFFRVDLDSYPPSEAVDPSGQPYCGAMKLCEAMMGQDLLGFHPDSVFRSDGMDATNTKKLYTSEPNNLKARRGPYLPLEITKVYRLKDIYEDVGPFDGNNYVICGVYTKKRHSGKKTGMPILYYKADTSKTAHDINQPDNPENIFNYKDNNNLLSLGVPGKPNKKHPLFTNPKIFYEMTKKWMVTPTNRTNRKDSFILLSAGKDGLYGTPDDIANFNMQ